MDASKRQSIAGMSLGGGRKENFYFCLMEYFADRDRWFLTTLKDVKDESSLDHDDTIMAWVDNYSIKQLVVDFPLTQPTCDSCDLECPGSNACHHPVVKKVREQMDELLLEDQDRLSANPKRYEQERVEDDKVHHSRSVMDKETHHHILSKSFKRKLKKGFIPYWNRPLDFWIWKHFYDQILNTFKVSYDSFGNVSVMLMKRFKYLMRHLPQELEMYESNTYITLLELHRFNILSKKQLLELQDITLGPMARLNIVQAIEKKCKIFIYENDLEIIVKNPKAFDSFILSVAGQSLVNRNTMEIPTFGEKRPTRFIVPQFS
jgi:hypothetical protein